MCETHLRKMYDGLYEEIPSYGLDCGDTSDLAMYHVAMKGQTDVEFMEGIGGITFVFTCICFFLASLLACIQFKKCYQERLMRKLEKQLEITTGENANNPRA